MPCETKSWGDIIPIRHKSMDKMMQMAGADLKLKRINYVDRYNNLGGFISPFTKIGE